MIKKTKQLNLNDKELLNYLKDQGRKLGFLIGYSTLPEKVKAELVSLIPKMKLEQIDRLMNIFEAKYVDEQTRDMDKEYKKKLSKIIEDYKRKQEKNDNEFLKQIKEIEVL